VPGWIAKLLPFILKTPWVRVAAVATWLFTNGKERLEKNLTKRERSELARLLAKSKGRPSKLAQRERTRVRRLVHKGATGSFPS
jgi:hypothetical protein